MRIKLSLLILLICFLVTGCTIESNRIYTICKMDSGSTYCYNDDGFYVVSGNSLIETSSVGLKPYPVLHVTPSAGEFVFSKDLPGCYKGTLESVNSYLYKLISDGCSYTVTYSDPNNIELYAECPEYKLRLLFNIKGTVRIYCLNNSGNYIMPPYINEE